MKNPFHLIYSIILLFSVFVNAKIRQTAYICDIFVGINYKQSTNTHIFVQKL